MPDDNNNNNNDVTNHQEQQTLLLLEESKDVCYDPKVADAVLAQDLNRLAVKDRNMILDDIHGVRTWNGEVLPSKLLQSLEQMNQSLEEQNCAASSTSTAYGKAVALNSQYALHNKELRIRFLRADEFDPKKAAQRFANYLDFYYKLFGTLMRPICFEDLNKEEQNILREGSIQLLPCRDRTERRILTRIGPMGSPGESLVSATCMRVNTYMMQVLSTDEMTQKHGCIMVFHSTYYEDEQEGYNQELSFLKIDNIKETMRKFIASFPVRVAAVHFCFRQTLQHRLAASALTLIAPSILRVRVRVHLGSQIECRYALTSYGIPGDQLPITSSGRIKTLNHQRWIKFQREKEDTAQMGLPPFGGIDCPLGMDVRIGNGGNNTSYFKNTPGNLLYRELLKQNYRDYEEASDVQEKTRLTWKILEELTQAGGRILVRDKRGWWTVASSAKCREKIAHDFRETRKKMTPNNNSNHNHNHNNNNNRSKKQRRSPPVVEEEEAEMITSSDPQEEEEQPVFQPEEAENPDKCFSL
eukprot:CAMPEP_0116129256 /NCGR_PEP_ID=MMETSP0329-20121206/7830_1 /TAXON_ID=697910 /ORGANISM="Pseudo-nitzschia arenysensis, Strain B593" /LENGTH=526 /DNA_ID=CAMNT_0003623517 /DNA_START=130 /DNA_END=1710 /DNA_ORIENTATION=+